MLALTQLDPLLSQKRVESIFLDGSSRPAHETLVERQIVYR